MVSKLLWCFLGIPHLCCYFHFISNPSWCIIYWKSTTKLWALGKEGSIPERPAPFCYPPKLSPPLPAGWLLFLFFCWLMGFYFQFWWAACQKFQIGGLGMRHSTCDRKKQIKNGGWKLPWQPRRTCMMSSVASTQYSASKYGAKRENNAQSKSAFWKHLQTV